MEIKIMNINDIIVTEKFVRSNPSEEKIEKCNDIYIKKGVQDRFVYVKEDNTLVDGYIQYLVLKSNGVKNVVVSTVDSKCYKYSTTTYVYAHHLDNSCEKYIWRIPKSKSYNWLRENVRVGDMIYVNSNGIVANVIVDNIELLDNSPVKYPVKKVVSKCLIRNGVVMDGNVEE